MSDDLIPLFDELALDRARGTLLRAGAPVHLRPQSYGVLEYLVEHRGRLVGKEELLDAVWQGRAVTDGSLGKCVEEVREALGESGRRYLRTVRGRGYLLDSEVGGPGADGVEAGARGLPTDNGKTGRRWLAWVAVALALVVAAALVAVRVIGRRSPAIPSVAVLPFVNASRDPDLEYVCDGISEGLINALSELPGLKVIARHSTFEYKGRELPVDLREVGRALGVQAIVTGRVAQRGENLMVSVELVDSRDRTQLWGDQYARRAVDLQSVQQEMARAVSDKLRFDDAVEESLGEPATASSSAYQFYLNGLFHLRKGGSDSATRALEYFQQAVTLDPDFALAWVGIANAESYFAGNSLLDPEGPMFRAKAAAQRALALDEKLAEAHVVLANIERNEWNWAGAEREYRRAVELNPNLVEARIWYSSFLSILERHPEALEELRRARDLDPLRPWKSQEVNTLLLARRFDEAFALGRTLTGVTDSAVGHQSLGTLYLAMGKHGRAIDEFRASIDLDPRLTSSLCYLGHALAQSGQREEALAILERLRTTQEYVSPAELAVLYAGLGDHNGAITALEQSYAAHDLQMQYLGVEWRLDSLRDDPRFLDLMKRVGLS